jgi:PAS domain-containing protein
MFKKHTSKSELVKIISVYVLILLVAFFYVLWFYQEHLKKDTLINQLYTIKLDITELQELQTNFLKQELLNENFFSTGKSKQTEYFEQKTAIIGKTIKALNLSTTKNEQVNVLFNSIKEDFAKLKTENKIFLEYIKAAGNEQTGIYSKLIIAETDFEKKLGNSVEFSNLQNYFSQIKIYRKLFYLYKDIQVLNIANIQLAVLTNELKQKHELSGSYKYLRLIDGLQEYKTVLKLYAHKLMQIGIRENEGITLTLSVDYQKINQRILKAVNLIEKEQSKNNFLSLLVVLFLIMLSISLNFIFHFKLMGRVKLFIKESEQYFLSVLNGKQVKLSPTPPNEDFTELQNLMNLFAEKLTLSSKLMSKLTKMGTLGLKEDDIKDAIFPEIRSIDKQIKSLNKQLKAETNATLINEWTRKGLASFSKVLRHNFDNPQQHAKKTLSNLVSYLNVPMGAIYLPSGKQAGSFDLVGSIAFGKEKHYPRSVLKGEGIVGTVAVEMKTINITDIPEDYFKVSSGFGEAKPKNIIVMPIKLDNKIYGIIELASLNKFKKFELEFMDELSTTLGASFAISSVFMETKEKLNKLEKELNESETGYEAFKKELENFKTENNSLANINAEVRIINESISTFALVAELDLDGNIMNMNNAFLELLKVQKETLLHINYQDYTQQIEKSNESDTKGLWNKVRTGTIINLTRNFLISDRTIWLSETYIPIKNNSGKVEKVKLIAFNETKLKTTELQVKKLAASITEKETKLTEKEKELNKLNSQLINKENELLKTRAEQDEITKKLKADYLKMMSDYSNEQKEKENALYEQIDLEAS